MTWMFTAARSLAPGLAALLAVAVVLPAFATDKAKEEQSAKSEKDQQKEAETKEKERQERERREREEKERRHKPQPEAAQPEHPKGEKNPSARDAKPAEKKPEPKQPETAQPAEKKPEEKKPEPKKPEPPKPAPLVASMLHEVDEDFQFQGEYLGRGARHSGQSHWGLQVIAEGGGKFRALVLPGGLPGAGWTRSGQVELRGERDGGVLRLSSETYSAEVYGDRAEVVGAHRAPVASLAKIHRISCTQDLAPPAGAIVLFDGSSTDAWNGAKISAEGLLQVGSLTKQPVRDFRLHLEFRTPYMPFARGQGRGNSGVYIQQRYEVQILDSFGLEGKNNEAGGLYQTRQPDVNMCLPPLSWQTYDIWFTAARFDAAGKKTADARITVYHNGERIHDQFAIPNKTGGGQAENPEPRPILLQDHGNPVRFRNIWLVEGASTPSLPGECICGAERQAAPPRAGLRRRRR